MRGSDAGRQYCFLAGLKSVVDKDGGEILVSSLATSGIACKHHSRTSSSVPLVCSRVQTTYLFGLLLCNHRPMHWLVITLE